MRRWALIADDVDITDLIVDRLLSLTLVDEVGQSADTLEINLDNRDGLLVVGTGATLRLFIDAVQMGVFAVDAISEQLLPADTLRIQAVSADMGTTLKSQKSREWHDTTLGKVMAEIAALHGLEPIVHPVLAAVAVEHFDQTDESDAALLTRLANDHDAVFKVTDQKLVFTQRASAHTVDGTPKPVIYIPRQAVKTLSRETAERGQFATIKARYRDSDNEDDAFALVGSGEPVRVLRPTYPDKAAASIAAKAALEKSARGRIRAAATLLGRADLLAESLVQFAGTRLEGETWAIERATHSLGNGHTVSLELVPVSAL